MMRPLLASNGLVGKLTKQKDADVARTVFLSVLSRRPSDYETAEISKHFATPGVAREELGRDLVWALLAGTEFGLITNGLESAVESDDLGFDCLGLGSTGIQLYG